MSDENKEIAKEEAEEELVVDSELVACTCPYATAIECKEHEMGMCKIKTGQLLEYERKMKTFSSEGTVEKPMAEKTAKSPHKPMRCPICHSFVRADGTCTHCKKTQGAEKTSRG